jgi:ABC-type spermidine/putrescine transport system permease subunit II
MIALLLLIQKTPLTPGVVVGPVVAFTRKVDPVRVTEFVAHKIITPKAVAIFNAFRTTLKTIVFA